MRITCHYRKASLFCAILLVLGACGASLESRIRHGEQRAAQQGWIRTSLPTGSFALVAFLPQQPAAAETAYIYIEGDGAAWRDAATPSLNPTPRQPVALELALQHGAGAAYLARPCQYVANDPACADNRWWTSHRFAPEVITASDRAIEAIKQRYRASHVVLIGYSGGGAVAALVAARRSDVSGLVTVAGNLDTQAWTALHDVEPLTGSLNPADYWALLQHIPQTHYVGTKDKIVPPAIAESFAARFPAGHRPMIRRMEGYDHQCCWIEHWPELRALLE